MAATTNQALVHTIVIVAITMACRSLHYVSLIEFSRAKNYLKTIIIPELLNHIDDIISPNNTFYKICHMINLTILFLSRRGNYSTYFIITIDC